MIKPGIAVLVGTDVKLLTRTNVKAQHTTHLETIKPVYLKNTEMLRNTWANV